MSSARVPAVILALWASFPGDLTAQGPADPRALRRAFDRASLESTWKIETTDGQFVGQLEARAEEWLRLAGSPDIRFETVERAWQRGRATGTGAKWGAIALGVVGAVAVGYDCSTEGAELDCNVPLATAVGGAAGAFGGFLVGLAIGSLFEQWHLRWP